MAQRTSKKNSSQQLGYRDLQILVAERKVQCCHDKRRIKEEIRASKTVIKHQLTRPSNLGIAFFSGFAADSLKKTRSQSSVKIGNTHRNQRSTTSGKLGDILVSTVIKELLLGT